MEPPEPPRWEYHEASDIPFETLERLGHGAFGIVDKVRCMHGDGTEVYARKAIWAPEFKAKEFEKEVRIIQRASHKHVIHLFGTYVFEGTLNIIMRPVAHCDLWKFLQDPAVTGLSITPERCNELLMRFPGCLLRRIDHIHKTGVVHSDIKASNILVHGDTILFTDSGISSVVAGPSNTGQPDFQQRHNAGRPLRQRDILQLGLVFMKMANVLFGLNFNDFDDFCRAQNRHARDPVALLQWVWYLWALWRQRAARNAKCDRNSVAVAVSQLTFFMLEPDKKICITAQQLLRLVSDWGDYHPIQKWCCEECGPSWDEAHGLSNCESYATFKPSLECLAGMSNGAPTNALSQNLPDNREAAKRQWLQRHIHWK